MFLLDSAYGKKECSQVPKEKCEDVPKQLARRVPKEDCKEEPRQECKKIPKQLARQECKDVPQEKCHQIPKQVKISIKDFDLDNKRFVDWARGKTYKEVTFKISTWHEDGN